MRVHLKVDRFIANTPALGPREAQLHNCMFQGHSGSNRCTFFFDPELSKVRFYSWQVLFLYLAELAKNLQSGAGNATLVSKERNNGSWTWLRALRRGCVRFVLLLAPYLPPIMPGRWLCGLWARWVGALVKVAVPCRCFVPMSAVKHHPQLSWAWHTPH